MLYSINFLSLDGVFSTASVKTIANHDVLPEVNKSSTLIKCKASIRNEQVIFPFLKKMNSANIILRPLEK